MKRNLLHLVLVLGLLCNAFCAFAADTETSENDHAGIRPDGKNIDEMSPDISAWALHLDLGGNYFDADFPQDGRYNPWFAPTVGFGATYNFTPSWGLGLEGKYSLLRVTGDGGSYGDNVTLFKSNMARMDLYSTFDLFNAWRPLNRRKIFALNVLLGGGGALYNRSEYMTYDGVCSCEGKGIPAGTASDGKDWKFAPYFFGGFDFQFNITRSVALGLKTTYTYFANDVIDSRIKGANNDGIVDLALSVRYKINAIDRSHRENMVNECRLLDAIQAREEAEQEAQKPQERDTVVMLPRDTVVLTMVVKEEPAIDECYYVYFDVNSPKLRDDALAVIQQVAPRLIADEDIYVAITGYCDNTGSVAINDPLGIARANRVQEEFVEEYGIDAGRFAACGKGILKGRRSKGSYAPNRRAEIRLLSREQFDEFKSQCPQPAQVESKSAVQTNGAKTIVVGKDETLGKIARREYGNAYCWIYIYEANSSRIPNPDYVQEGMSLLLPVLTAEQIQSAKTAVQEQAKQTPANQVSADMNLSGKVIAKEVVRADWTLSKMARKHYGNAYCWVYLYMANKNSISDPDNVQIGTEIDIPELNEAQQMITKAQANYILSAL